MEGVISSSCASIVLHLFLKCVGQHMAAPVRVCESREKLLTTEEELGPAVVVS